MMSQLDPPTSNDDSTPTPNTSGMDRDQDFSQTFSVDSQGALHLDHNVRKWLKADGPMPHIRPHTPFSIVTFVCRINAQVYEAANNRNNDSNNSNGNGNNNSGGSSRALPLVDSMEEPIEVILGVTKIFRGLEIALRSMAVGEHADFFVPAEMGHYFGGGNSTSLPPRCPIDMDVKLLSCENGVQIPRLPMVDYDAFKIQKTGHDDSSSPTQPQPQPSSSSSSSPQQKKKRVVFGSKVDFLLQRPHKHTGVMGAPQRFQGVEVGMATVDPVLDLMLMSMVEREISMFVLRSSGSSSDVEQISITTISVTPPASGLAVSNAHIIKVYNGDETGVSSPMLDNNNNNNNSAGISSDGAAAAGSGGADAGGMLQQTSSSGLIELGTSVKTELERIQDIAKKAFEDERLLVATWHYAAASAITRQRGGNMNEVNCSLARYSRNMGRCAFKLKRFNEALHLGRESYAFDSNDAKGAFLLAQALRETDQLNEAQVILQQVEKMPNVVTEFFMAEKGLLEAKIAVKSTPSSAQETPSKS